MKQIKVKMSQNLQKKHAPNCAQTITNAQLYIIEPAVWIIYEYMCEGVLVCVCGCVGVCVSRPDQMADLNINNVKTNARTH